MVIIRIRGGDRPLHWRHNDHDGVSNRQPHGCLLNRLFRRGSKKTSTLRVTGLCVGNSPGPVNSPYKGPFTRKMFPFDDVIMQYWFNHAWHNTHRMKKLSSFVGIRKILRDKSIKAMSITLCNVFSIFLILVILYQSGNSNKKASISCH